MLARFAVAFAVSVPLSAQVTPLGNFCTGGSHLNFSAPLAGAVLQVDQTTFYFSSPSTPCATVWLHAMGIAFASNLIGLPSCGCTMLGSPAWIEVQVGTPSLRPSPIISPFICHLQTSTSLALPPGSAGMQFYVQALALAPGYPVGSMACTEFGAPTLLTGAYEVAVQ